MSTTMPKDDVIESVSVATVLGQLPEPIVFGDWVMQSREFALVRMRSAAGTEGWAFTLTRDGAVADQIRKSLAQVYVGQPVGDQERLFTLAWRRSLASHASGVGLRALSLLDLAAWDLAARSADVSIAGLLDGSNQPMPATAIVGYPPSSTGPAEIAAQVGELYATGWRRFKVAVSADHETTRRRLRAVRFAAPGSWLGLDGAWVFQSVDEALSFANSIADLELGWFEDIFPPGDAAIVAELRRRAPMPIAMGDEQGGLYYPEALIQADAVDVVRIDLTCMGGITRGRKLIEQCLQAGVKFAPHMNGIVHSQVFGALGHADVPVEWGVPWTGVDPIADSLRQPEIAADGLMKPLPEEPGFGTLVNRDWVLSQPYEDPDHLLET
jgi:L-alanine-DL-glutamate epimerase-like enolase superfamily enzyme